MLLGIGSGSLSEVERPEESSSEGCDAQRGGFLVDGVGVRPERLCRHSPRLVTQELSASTYAHHLYTIMTRQYLINWFCVG